MAVDQVGVRRDLLDLIKVFGPANAGGPAQMNTNPGSNPNPPPDLAGGKPEEPAPGPQAAAAGSVGPAPTQAPPTPTGVRVLPPGAPVKPNGQDYIVPGSPEVNQSAIELLPGDADPNLLPPEIRNSPLFRYMQAQRVAQFKQAQEEAQWQRIVGGVGNIAQIATGQAPTFQQGSPRAQAPGQLDIGALHTLQEDAAKASASAKYQDLVARITRERPDLSPNDIAAMAQDPKKLADYGYNRADSKAIADAAKANFDAQKAANDLPGGNINDPEIVKETAKLLNQSEAYVRAMPINERLNAAREIVKSREAGAGYPGQDLTKGVIARTNTAIETARNDRAGMFASQRAFDIINDKNNDLWTGKLYGQPAVQSIAQMYASITGDRQIPGITTAQELKNYIQDQTVRKASTFGKSPSDAEGRAIAALVGADGTINRDALRTILQNTVRRQVQSHLDATDQIDTTMKQFPGDKRVGDVLGPEREFMAQVPDVIDKIYEAPVVSTLLAHRNDPAVLADFDREYGRGQAAYIIAKRGGGS